MKDTLRKNILQTRKSLKFQYVADAEKKVYVHLSQMEVFKSASNIMIYIDFQNEMKTKKIIEYLLDAKKDVVVPLISKDKSHIIPINITSFEDLCLGNFGILEPKIESSAFQKEKLDLIIVPGVVFDRSGNRIGFGKGYYDGFLSSLKGKVPFVALAYDFQVLESIPAEAHDIKMDYIVTPEGIIEIRE